MFIRSQNYCMEGSVSLWSFWEGGDWKIHLDCSHSRIEGRLIECFCSVKNIPNRGLNVTKHNDHIVGRGKGEDSYQN
jgi:hypothetical protein